MNAYARSADTYLTQRILGASPEQQAALIMEAGQLHLGKAIQALVQDDLSAASSSFLRVSECTVEAITRLDLAEGGQAAQSLLKLYEFWTREIMVASRARDTIRLEEVLRSMGEIRQAWEQLHAQKAAVPGPTKFQLGDQVV